MSAIKYYLDENVPTAVARSLSARGIDAVTVRDSGVLGDSDVNHLVRARETGRVVCMHDADFLRLDAQGIDDAGIVFSPKGKANIGVWVRGLVALHARLSAEEMVNRVEFV
ncbi:MAG: DUF5615 family PIN-like protein [Anaerolineae bacterium]|nr:DUF5615 family PIN-like protein [Anaerolineae bacterium]